MVMMRRPLRVSLGAPTVLLVGEASDDRQMYAECLRLERFRPVETDSPAQALELARAVDVVVTGIRLPGPFDGIELVRRLRAQRATRSVPIIVLTASGVGTIRQRAEAAGCNAFLSKPCLPDAFVAAVRRMLGTDVSARRRARGTSRRGAA